MAVRIPNIDENGNFTDPNVIARLAEALGIILPPDPNLPWEGTTLWSDDFNRANADTLGEGWVVGPGTAGIRTNAAGILSAPSGNTYAYRAADANGILRATLAAKGTHGPYYTARFNTTTYDRVALRGQGGNWVLQKVVGSTTTTILDTGIPVTTGDRTAIRMDGDLFALRINESNVWSGTITSTGTGSHAGFLAWAAIADYRIDDMTFETLTA